MESYVTPETILDKSKKWLEHISSFNTHKMQLSRDKSALIVIDMQYFFLDPASPSFTCGGLAILPKLKKIIHAFREAGRPVIFTRHVHHPDGSDAGITGWWWEGMCKEGTPESEIHQELAPKSQRKGRLQTPLLGVLQHRSGNCPARPQSRRPGDRRDHDQHVLRIHGSRRLFSRLSGFLPRRWNRERHRGDAPLQSAQSSFWVRMGDGY